MIERRVDTKNFVGETLVGVEDRPDIARQQYPTVVFVHGFYGDRDELGMFTEFARALTAHGFFVYRFDLSGCGESQGKYEQTSLTKLAEDLRAIIDFVRAQPIVDQSRLGLLGFSLGTATILALRPRDIRCLVLAGSIAHPYKILQELFSEGFHPGQVSIRVTSSGKRVAIGPQFWPDLQHYNLVHQMRTLPVPTLFLHGEQDDIVSAGEARALFATAANPKEFILVPGDRHKLTNPMAAAAVVEWFEKYLR